MFLYSSVYAEDLIQIDMRLPRDEQIEQQLEYIAPILEKAQKNNDLRLYIKASERAYYTKKSGNIDNVKRYNDYFSALAIEYSLQRYELTKQDFYLENAYYWSKRAIKDKTNQIYSIRAAIMLASAKLNLKNMTKAYDLYREIDLEGANKFKQDYLNQYDLTMKLIAQRSEERNRCWAAGLAALGAGLQGVAQSQPRTYSSTSIQYGNHTYTTFQGN